ncbi:hypothetical protein STXM2123_1201 [Streptomyces sp. F-3]|nr:hypothetical protein STXM2123_1201 [Streptomyces sp. F-3]
MSRAVSRRPRRSVVLLRGHGDHRAPVVRPNPGKLVRPWFWCSRSS